MALRTELLAAQSCRFQADITADYGDRIYQFSMDCQGDRDGNLTFTVREPENISGICGKIEEAKGKLTFDDVVLDIPLLADGLLSPLGAPWVFLKTLRSGYMVSAGTEGDGVLVRIDDSYREDAMHLDIRLNAQDIPEWVEILWNGQRYLSMEIREFRME